MSDRTRLQNMVHERYLGSLRLTDCNMVSRLLVACIPLIFISRHKIIPNEAKIVQRMRFGSSFALAIFGCMLILPETGAFAPGATSTNLRPTALEPQIAPLALAAGDVAAPKPSPELTEAEEKVYGLLQDLHESKLEFRIVVVGNGAILESTNLLGPTMKLSQSPKSGVNLVTFASSDQSFEFHLQTAAVSTVVFLEKSNPTTSRTMRILRFTNKEGQSICSLILAEDSDAVAEWYKSMTSKYGEEFRI